MPRVAHLGQHIPTTRDIENELDNIYKSSPSYDIRNNNWNNYAEPIYTLIQPSSDNNLYGRTKRFLEENYYITYNDWQDKLLTAILIAGFILSMVILYNSRGLNINQPYVFNNPDDMSDPTKVAKLRYLNKNKNTWDIISLIFTSIPGIIAAWRIFKRTSVPPPMRERRANLSMRHIGVATRNLFSFKEQ